MHGFEPCCCIFLVVAPADIHDLIVPIYDLVLGAMAIYDLVLLAIDVLVVLTIYDLGLVNWSHQVTGFRWPRATFAWPCATFAWP